MANIQIFPLLEHSMLITVRESIRSSHELFGISPDKCRTTAEDLVLAHPPVLWINAGGGEQLLNRDAVNSQLSYRERPVGLRCWVIDQNALKKDATLLLLYTFIFGPIQNLFYQKKQGGKSSWKIIMQKVEKDEYLKNIIEYHLFDGEKLAPRHYKMLLSAALVGESSINHELGKIRRKNVRTSEKDTSEMSTEKSSSVADFSHKEENKKLDNEQQPKNNKSFDMSESLANIKNASEKGPMPAKFVGKRDQERFTAGRDE